MVQVDVAGQDRTLSVVTLKTVLVSIGQVDGNSVIVMMFGADVAPSVEVVESNGVREMPVAMVPLIPYDEVVTLLVIDIGPRDEVLELPKLEGLMDIVSVKVDRMVVLKDVVEAGVLGDSPGY